MRIGVLKCLEDPLVAATPVTASKWIKEENEVIFEQGAGEQAYFPDEVYTEVGVKVVSRDEVLQQSDIIITVSSISDADLKMIPEKTKLVGIFNPHINTDLVSKFNNSHILPFSLELLPRTSIAQSMDVLSSLASLAGYKAVISAANLLPGYFPMLTTAAGTVPPAKVLVLGAGVAGLQAIATAKRLGAVVEAFDVRSAVKQEVESLGAKFVEVEGSSEDKDAGGYAVEQSEEYIKKQKALIHEKAMKADVVVTTANIPGKKAPVLIEKATVDAMSPGSVVVDMASATGGNCEYSKDKETVLVGGVSIIGDSKLAVSLPREASKLYATNVYNFIKHMSKSESGFDLTDEIVNQPFLGNPEILQTEEPVKVEQ
ncbi:MAG: NAD(P) transhydrogenase subunit alpha [bacterium]|nr:NAD(P) transhydrogenase subunit alpha [bacterium]